MDIDFADLPLPLLLLVRRTGGRADEPEEVDAAAAVAGETVSSSTSSITMGIWRESMTFRSSVPNCPMLDQGVDSELPMTMSKFQITLTLSFLLT